MLKMLLFVYFTQRLIRAAQVLIVCNYRNSFTAGRCRVTAFTDNLFCSCFFFSSLTVLKVFNASCVCRDLWVSLQQQQPGLRGFLWPQQHSAGWGPDVRADWFYDRGKTTEAPVHDAFSVWVLCPLTLTPNSDLQSDCNHAWLVQYWYFFIII